MKYQCHCAQQCSLLQSVWSIQHCRSAAHRSRSHCTDHVKRSAVSASRFECIEPVYTRRVSTSAKVREVRSKNDANIEEMIADGGFGFHAKVK